MNNYNVIQDIMEYIEYLDFEMGVDSANIKFDSSSMQIKCHKRQDSGEEIIMIEKERS